MYRGYNIFTKIYYSTLKIVGIMQQAIQLPFEAFWLGISNKEFLHDIDKYYYDINPTYHSAEYNNQGFFEWEEKAVREHFSECRTILVAGAGAGREMLALIEEGFEVCGFDCNESLVNLAHKNIEEKGYSAKVFLSDRDDTADIDEIFDGIIVGWAVYMHIPERESRVEFLKKIRRNIKTDGPLLLSFFVRKGNPKNFQLLTSMANIIRKLLGKKKIDVGDRLAPNFIHYFTKDEIEKELSCARFSLVEFSAKQYGYAIAKAV
ncbi:MAG: class I SAM-dependent methyltransferase [Candidatus Schekmanbacteria bacterium]|nr:MAG: class I SAM-dependent methyltransferase [Candidatus Schekmanbacteria bacterium]